MIKVEIKEGNSVGFYEYWDVIHTKLDFFCSANMQLLKTQKVVSKCSISDFAMHLIENFGLNVMTLSQKKKVLNWLV